MAKIAMKIGTEDIEVVNVAPLILALDKLKKEVSQNIGGDEKLKGELSGKIDSIIKGKRVETDVEKVSDLAQIISKSPEISNGSEIGVMAKKIELAAEELGRQYPNELEILKKEEFVKDFENETKELNSNLNEDQLKNIKDYGELVAENSFGENVLDDYQNEALEANKEFGPGKLENSWSDLKQVVNFLQKSPEEIKDVKEKYNSIKDKLKGVNLPGSFKEARSFEKMFSSLSNSYIDDLFSGTKKYLGWADRVDKLTGGWLNKTITKAGQKLVSKIGNQTIQEFAKNGLEKIASEGFEKGFTNILKGVLEGGIKTTASTGGASVTGAELAGAAGSAVSGAAESVIGGVAAGGTSASGVVVGSAAASGVVSSGATVGGAAVAATGGVAAGAATGGTAAGVVGGVATGGVTVGGAAVAAPAAAVIAIIVVAVVLGLFLYQLFQGSTVSSLVPPEGANNYEEVIENGNENGNDNGNDNYENINYTGSDKTIGSYQIGGVTYYVFEGAHQNTISQKDRYDLGVLDPSLLALVPKDYWAGCQNKTSNGFTACMLDQRVIPPYIALVKAARASGKLIGCQLSGDLKLTYGYRTEAQQDYIWKHGSGNSVYAAPPDTISAHRTGRALDLVINCGIGSGERESGYPTYNASSTYEWLLENAAKFGFYPYDDEPWHWTYNPAMPEPKTNAL